MRSPGRYVSRGVCSRNGRIALGASEVDDDVVALLEAPDDALDELALAVLELVEDEVALVVAHALDEHLLRRLRRDAAEGLARLLHAQEVAELLVLLGGLLRVRRVPEDLEAELLAELRLEACASARPRWRSRARRPTTSSTTVMYWKRSTWPLSSLKRASSSRVGAEHALRGLEDRLLDRLRRGAPCRSPCPSRPSRSPEGGSNRRCRSAAVGLPCCPQCFLCWIPCRWSRTRTRGARSRCSRAGISCVRLPSTTRTRPSVTPSSSPTTMRSPADPLSSARRLSSRLVAREAGEVALGPERPLDARRAHLELVGVGDEVDDVERGAEVARDVRAELEADRGIARRQRLVRTRPPSRRRPAGPSRLARAGTRCRRPRPRARAPPARARARARRDR